MREIRTEYATTCIAWTRSSEAAALSTAHRLTRTRNAKHFVEDHRYFDSVYADNLRGNVKRLYDLIDSLKVGHRNAPDTQLDEGTQHTSDNQLRSVSQLNKTNG